MNAHSPLPLDAPADPEADLAAWGEAVLRRQSAIVEALSEAALRMAQAIERQVTEPPAEGMAPVAATKAAMAFSRVARAVRMAALLQSRLIHDAQALAESPARLAAASAAAAAAAEAAESSDPVYRHKVRVENVVARLARAACGGNEHRLDRIMNEVVERLDDEDLYGEVLTRPIGELVALICRDLGLEPNWARLAEEAWARAEAEGGDPRSPFAPTSPIAASPACGGGGPRSGGEGIPPPPPFDSSDVPTSSLVFDSC